MSINHKLDYLEKHKEEIIRLFEAGHTQIEIRKIFKVADETFRKFTRIHNIGRRTKHEVKKLMDDRNYKNISESTIIDTYNSGFGIQKTAFKYHISQKRVLSILRNHDILRKSRKVIPPEAIKTLYYDERMSMKQISNHFKISKCKLTGLFKKYNLHIRDDAYLRKKYILPSGKIIFIQGYEPQFLDFVFSNKIFKENEICFSYRVIPYIDENGVNRKYIPDFYIPKYNLIIEIKSSWILRIQNESRVKCKEEGTKSAGYNFYMIINNNFNEFINHINTIYEL
jgi:hypothetical protein